MKNKVTLRCLPIDFAAIAEETGLRRGKLCKTAFGWGVQNTYGEPGADVALITPPAMRENESELRIVEGDGCSYWCFYGLPRK